MSCVTHDEAGPARNMLSNNENNAKAVRFVALGVRSTCSRIKCRRTHSLGGQVGSPPRLEIIEREGALDAVTPAVELRKRFSQTLLRDLHAKGFQQVTQLASRNKHVVDRCARGTDVEGALYILFLRLSEYVR